MQEPRSLSDILQALRNACSGSTVSIDDVLDEIGHRSFAPAILVPALLLVSPISGIPGLPTIGSIVILFFTLQALFGVESLWLPRFIRFTPPVLRQGEQGRELAGTSRGVGGPQNRTTAFISCQTSVELCRVRSHSDLGIDHAVS